MVYSLQTCSCCQCQPRNIISNIQAAQHTENVRIWVSSVVFVRDVCLFVFVSINVRIWAFCWEGEKASAVRMRESKWRPQVYAVSVWHTEHTVSLHIREQQQDPPIGCHPTPLPEHTHIQRQWLLLSETEMHYVLSLTLSTTYSHKTARMNTQLHGGTSETVCLNQTSWPNTTHWEAQIYTWYLLNSRSVEFWLWWVVHTDSDFNRWKSEGQWTVGH